ncbi:nonsense-mediated mRNA decay factor SMG7 [Raphanus sativus]|uniref:Nonsense-mediated mRNA decay factor SMG7 n=1 Tax=Raphanus sativus TaxID=3726 RepID=A0A6J0K970_RAPSA|nr:nonsense-mediated mRNA decay factor SMG7 [Raphanus sativus]XP_018443951.2 nonsense-mediated mRNA decay factor SMG7 [Raphanus sativus]
MMTLQMDKNTASSPRERAQSIFDKTVELEIKRRKAAQARNPFDPNLWQQIRENYEAIVLEDHTFCEEHNIEFTLWQLHYKRIEDFRSHISAVLASSNSSSVAQNSKGPSRPDRVANLKLQFRTFLSEATGFYHEMILKIRAKYGLPLGYFQDSQNLADKDGKKIAEVQKGLVSCHRCLIYLGDLARYKGLYGEGDSKNREHAAASSYYLQAASLLPGSGNPHHQLAIIASYSGDEFAATYRYFRSLAVETPFPTARDNLIVAFEKNRQSYAQLFTAPKAKDSSRRPTGKRRGKGGDISSKKEADVAAVPEKDKVTSADEMLKAFCIRFVRLNGILFTRTSLETFSDVLASTSSSLRDLISSSLKEEMIFGKDTSDSALFIVRLVTILIFSVDNSKKEKEGQSYAEIVNRVELARNSLTASFELVGHVIEQCAQLSDPSSSYFLPGVLVFVEWLACCPDIALGSDPDEKRTAVRNSFWNQCVTFFNQILTLGPRYIDDVEDETCFSNMSTYDERETENRLALWEDYELRGFLPLLPAQSILDFSRRSSFGSEGPKEKKARIQRILAAGKALTSVIKVDQNHVYFDSKKKKFLVGSQPSDDLLDSHSSPAEADNVFHLGEEDDDDEEIVFKPLVTVKSKRASDEIYVPNGGFKNPDQVATMGDFKALNVSDAAFHENLLLQSRGNASVQLPASAGTNLVGHLLPSTQSQGVQLQQFQTQSVHPQPAQSLASARLQQMQSQVAQQSQVALLQQLQSRAVHFQDPHGQVPHVSMAQSQSASLGGSKWLPEEAASSLPGFAQMGNGHVMRNEMQGNHGVSYYPAHSLPIHQSFNVNGMAGMPYSQSRTSEAMLRPIIDATLSSGMISDGMGVQSSVARKSPISRASKHLGPPPGFNSVPSKLQKDLAPGPDMSGSSLPADDYSWLDGYQGQSHQGIGFNSSLNYASSGKPEYNGPANFPFPGKQALAASQAQAELPHFQHPQKDNLVNVNYQSAQLPQQYQGQPSWSNRHFV